MPAAVPRDALSLALELSQLTVPILQGLCSGPTSDVWQDAVTVARALWESKWSLGGYTFEPVEGPAGTYSMPAILIRSIQFEPSRRVRITGTTEQLLPVVPALVGATSVDVSCPDDLYVLQPNRFQGKKLLRTTEGFDAVVSLVAETCGSSLRQLLVRNRNSFTGSSLEAVVKHCPNLELLDVGFDEPNYLYRPGHVDSVAKALQVSAPRLPELQFLGIGCLNNISDGYINEMVEKCPNLRGIDVRFTNAEEEVTGASIANFAAKRPLLEHLDLGFTDQCVDVEGIANENACRNLRHVDLTRFCGSTSDASIIALAKYGQLRYLNLTETFMDNSVLVEMAPHLGQLHHLNIGGHETSLGDAGLLAVMDHCPNLRELVLTFGSRYRVSAKSLVPLVQKVPLEAIEMSCVDDDVIDATMRTIAKSCPTMRFMVVGERYQAETKTAKAMKKALPGIVIDTMNRYTMP